MTLHGVRPYIIGWLDPAVIGEASWAGASRRDFVEARVALRGLLWIPKVVPPVVPYVS